MRVEELSKPQGQWCEHCKIGQGCGIYETRPQSCREFQCLWLTEDWVPIDLRPDKSKVVIDDTTDGKYPVLWCDEKYPDAWDKGEMKVLVSVLLKHVDGVIVACGDKRKWVSNKGASSEVEVRKEKT